jgi:predicted branched-subunit amino acid permease
MAQRAWATLSEEEQEAEVEKVGQTFWTLDIGLCNIFLWEVKHKLGLSFGSRLLTNELKKLEVTVYRQAAFTFLQMQNAVPAAPEVQVVVPANPAAAIPLN